MSDHSFQLTLREVASILGYRDTRSAKRWCKNHSVMVLSDQGTKGSYVIRTEFEAIRLGSLVKVLQSRYGNKKWKSILKLLQSGDVSGVIEFLNGETRVKKTKRNKEKPLRSENEQRFHDEINALLSEAS